MSERWVWRLQERPEGMDFEPAFEFKSEPIPDNKSVATQPDPPVTKRILASNKSR